METDEELDSPCASRTTAVILFRFALPAFASLIFLAGPAACETTADTDFQRGMAFAQQQQWRAAIQAFESGRRKAPGEARFPIELAGIAFKQKRYKDARDYLRTALRLRPADEYTVQFLGTIYFLQGNLDAALHQWNKIRRPYIETVKINGNPTVRSDLLDRAITVSFAGVLQLDDLKQTGAAIEQLEIFPRFTFRLVPHPGDRFDLIFNGIERNGFGNSRIDILVSLLRGIPYQTIYPEYYNWKQSAINFRGLVRWDADRRRLWSTVSAPLKDPKHRIRLTFDARDEVWNLNSAETDFYLRGAQGGFELDSLLKHQWRLENGFAFSHRHFDDASFQSGNAIEYAGRIRREWEYPESNISSTISFSANAGRFLSNSSRFLTLELGNSWSKGWFKTGIGAGKGFGSVPFDRLFVLGIDRDRDRPLRGHSDLTGKKGDLPIGNAFVLINSEADKIIFRHPLFHCSAGPFLDSGKVFNSPAISKEKWLVDSGLQIKFRVLNSISAAFVYGRDLRTGSDTFYINLTR